MVVALVDDFGNGDRWCLVLTPRGSMTMMVADRGSVAPLSSEEGGGLRDVAVHAKRFLCMGGSGGGY